MQITAEAIKAQRRTMRLLMLGSGCIVQGGWCLVDALYRHVGVFLCTDVSYTPGLTIFSMLPGVAASWVALRPYQQKKLSMTQLLLGCLLMGACIGAMHYTGMATACFVPPEGCAPSEQQGELPLALATALCLQIILH